MPSICFGVSVTWWLVEVKVLLTGLFHCLGVEGRCSVANTCSKVKQELERSLAGLFAVGSAISAEHEALAALLVPRGCRDVGQADRFGRPVGPRSRNTRDPDSKV